MNAAITHTTNLIKLPSGATADQAREVAKKIGAATSGHFYADTQGLPPRLTHCVRAKGALSTARLAKINAVAEKAIEEVFAVAA